MNTSFTSPNNSISTSIGDSITAPVSNIFSGESTATNTDSGSGWGWSTWIIIILILAFLGFNIFIYLAKGTQVFANLSAKFASVLGTGTAEVTKQVVNTAATGTKAAADITAGTVNSTLNYAEHTASQIKQANNSQQQQLNNSLNQANKSYNGEDEEQMGYKADESSSSIQSSKSSGKSGWCYIGEDRGFRSCIKVGENDQCMSGDIYPSEQICMYPEMRA